MIQAFTPNEGFDWSKVTWGRPDSPPSVLCSYCSASIPEDSVPLTMWTTDNYCVRFCDACMETWWSVSPRRRKWKETCNG
jgi:hypothetical protein